MIDIQSLVVTASPQDRVKLTIHHNAVVKCTRAYQDDPTAGRLRDLRSAEEALAAEVERLSPADVAAEDTQDDHFPHKLAAWEYLRDSGWQISKSQFYEHCKQGRLPRKDGHYLRADVDRYAKTHCKLESTGERVNDTLARMAEEKASTELSREKVRLEREIHDLAARRGEYVPRDEVELMIVGRAVAMLAHLKAMVQMRTPDWIELVGGDQARGRDLIDTVWIAIEEHLSLFARDIEFDVIFEKNTPDQGLQEGEA